MLLLLAVVSLVVAAEGQGCSDGAVRLVGGPNEFEGRVEVCIAGEWGRWCTDSIAVDETNVNVVCRQLHGATSTGFSMVSSALYGTGNSSLFVTNVSCVGNERSVAQCLHETFKITSQCGEVAVICRAPGCDGIRLVGGSARNEGLVDICSGGSRVGLCSEDFSPEAAAVLCRQLGFSANNSVISAVDQLRYFTTLRQYTCTGEEEDFSDCGPLVATGRACPSVRLTCSLIGLDRAPNPVSTANTVSTTTQSPELIVGSTGPSNSSNNTVSAFTTASMATTTSSPTGTPVSVPLTTILAVACVVLLLLLTGSVAVLVLVLCRKRRRNTSKVTLQAPEEPGMSNINYELAPNTKSQHFPAAIQDERTVHNVLYTTSDIPPPTTRSSITRGQTVVPYHQSTGNEYAAIGPGANKNRDLYSSQVSQKPLLHSTSSMSNEIEQSDYSEPVTKPEEDHDYSEPATKHEEDRRKHSLADTAGARSHNYSNVNGALKQSQSDHSQLGLEDREYSEIDGAHKYSKLNDARSRGYSQLDRSVTVTTELQGRGFPYEMPTSPTSNSTEAEDTHPTLSSEADDMGYSKLHVFEDSLSSSKVTRQGPNTSVRANVEDELEDNFAYESWRLRLDTNLSMEEFLNL